MSICRAIHFEDDTYVELGPEAPAVYRQYDYGSDIPQVWAEVAELGRGLGLGDLDRFVCPDEVYQDAEELLEELEEAEEEGEEDRAAELRAELSELLPAHDPSEVSAVVRGLIAHLEATPEAIRHGLTENTLVDLRAYEIALGRAATEQRKVFISPY